jgi:hypothetical protein
VGLEFNKCTGGPPIFWRPLEEEEEQEEGQLTGLAAICYWLRALMASASRDQRLPVVI